MPCKLFTSSHLTWSTSHTIHLRLLLAAFTCIIRITANYMTWPTSAEKTERKLHGLHTWRIVRSAASRVINPNTITLTLILNLTPTLTLTLTVTLTVCIHRTHTWQSRPFLSVLWYKKKSSDHCYQQVSMATRVCGHSESEKVASRAFDEWQHEKRFP